MKINFLEPEPEPERYFKRLDSLLTSASRKASGTNSFFQSYSKELLRQTAFFKASPRVRTEGFLKPKAKTAFLRNLVADLNCDFDALMVQCISIDDDALLPGTTVKLVNVKRAKLEFDTRVIDWFDDSELTKARCDIQPQPQSVLPDANLVFADTRSTGLRRTGRSSGSSLAFKRQEGLVKMKLARFAKEKEMEKIRMTNVIKRDCRRLINICEVSDVKLKQLNVKQKKELMQSIVKQRRKLKQSDWPKWKLKYDSRKGHQNLTCANRTMNWNAVFNPFKTLNRINTCNLSHECTHSRMLVRQAQ